MAASERLKAEVVNQLRWDARLQESDIDIAVQDGHVKLRGTVSNVCARGAAEDDARSVSGVESVENKIRVAPSTRGSSVSDEEIRARTESLLMWTPDIDASDIKVTVRSGNVILEGSVDAAWKKKKATELVASLAGVCEITNALSIVASGKPPDKVLAAEVTKAVSEVPDVDLDRVDIAVEEGTVTVEGDVPNQEATAAVGAAAGSVSGVRQVDNRLRVS